MEKVRAKFKCDSITQRHSGSQDNEVLYSAEFSPVHGTYGDSHENKQFWKWTPSGSFKVDTVKRMPFEVGKSYYIDVIDCSQKTKMSLYCMAVKDSAVTPGQKEAQFALRDNDKLACLSLQFDPEKEKYREGVWCPVEVTLETESNLLRLAG